MANRIRTLAPGLPPRTEVADLADAREVRECLLWFGRERRWIDEQHLQLCRIPAPTFMEQRRAEWFATQLASYGCDARTDRAGNVVAWLEPDRGGPCVALTAHLDTVLAPRTQDDIRVESDGSFHGPGVADNGAGLAALLAVAKALKTCPVLGSPQLSLLLVANVGEEGEGNLSGMRYLCRQSPLAGRIRSFLILDGPATEHITWQALASRRYEITILGSGGHSWSDHGTGNPVHALCRAISLFSENRSVVAAAGPRSSFNFGVVDGGTSVTSIPTSARAKVDLRSESPDRMEELAAVLTGSVERAVEVENDRATGGKVTARIKEIGSRPGGKLGEDSPVLAWLRAVDQHLGIRSRLDCASTDANIPLSMGLEAISIGAGGQGGGAHTTSEWFHPDGRELGLRRILLTLCMLLRNGDSNGAPRE